MCEQESELTDSVFFFFFFAAAAPPRFFFFPLRRRSKEEPLPGGGAIAIGVTFAMLGSWGFTPTEAGLYVGVTGIWNIFTKLGLPVIALALLVLKGHVDPALVGAAAVGVATLAVAVTLLVLVFRSEAMARRVGGGSAVRLGRHEAVRQGARQGMDDRAAKFRNETIILVRQRWIRLTWTTVLSQLALCLVLVVSLASWA